MAGSMAPKVSCRDLGLVPVAESCSPCRHDAYQRDSFACNRRNSLGLRTVARKLAIALGWERYDREYWASRPCKNMLLVVSLFLNATTL
jgi:hypothetical protein